MSDLVHLLGPWMDSADGPGVVAATRMLVRELSSEVHQHARGQLFGSIKGLISVQVDGGFWVVPAIHAV